MLTPDTAELLGMHAGDGTLYRTSTGLVWELRGNHDEKEFYDWYVIPLLRRLGFALSGHRRSGGKNGCYGVRCCKKELHTLFLDAGFPVGRKTYTAHVPRQVREGSPDIKAKFLAGLFATDGTSYVQRSYPFIELATASPQLVRGSAALLTALGIEHTVWAHHSRWKPIRHIRISGKRRVQKFSEIIGFSNPKHFRRVEQFLKY